MFIAEWTLYAMATMEASRSRLNLSMTALGNIGVQLRSHFLRVLLSLAGLFILVILFYRLGPANVLELLQRLGWKILVVVLIYACEELIRAAALLQCLPEKS